MAPLLHRAAIKKKETADRDVENNGHLTVNQLVLDNVYCIKFEMLSLARSVDRKGQNLLNWVMITFMCHPRLL